MQSKYFDTHQYMSISEVQHLVAKEFINAYRFNQNEKILDIGCGDAKTTCFLATKTRKKVLGIDSEKTMLTSAKKQIDAVKMSRVSVKLADAQNFSLGKFDLITSYFCLHMVDSVSAVFHSVANALNINGHGFIVVPNDDNYFLKATEMLYQLPKWQALIRLPSKKRLERNLSFYQDHIQQNRLVVKEGKVHDVLFRFNSSNNFKKWLRVMLGQLNLLPKVNTDLFFREAITAYTNYLHDVLSLKDVNIFVFQVINLIFYKPN